ncbi:hypothetical protein B0H13DRAFT_2377678 [Mycena leptocephala]|nr:hypothetical protein B0H13DRAFT_2377678 [Mycena leptocephala]
MYEDSDPANSDDPMAPPNTYHQAAAELEDNILWKSVREHVVVENETSCKTAIDLVLLTAINLAQQQIATKKDVDDTLRTRHHIVGDNDSSWVVLHQDVDVPDQDLLPTVAFHGILDYLIGVVSATNAQETLKFSKAYLTAADLKLLPSLRENIRTGLALVFESKTKSEVRNTETWAHVAAQGAALTVYMNRPSIMNILTDGQYWQFVYIGKIPDQDRSAKAAAAATSSRPAGGSGNRRSTRLASSTKKPSLPPVAETPRSAPFKSASTRFFNILEEGNLAIILCLLTLTIILRLLTLTIISSPEEFVQLAAGAA